MQSNYFRSLLLWYMSGSKAMLLSFRHKVTSELTGVRSLSHYTQNFITHTPLWNQWMWNCCVVPVSTDVQVPGMSTDTAGASELFRRVRKC